MQLLALKSFISCGIEPVLVKSMSACHKATSSLIYTPPPISLCTCLPPYAPFSLHRKHHRRQWQQVRLLHCLWSAWILCCCLLADRRCPHVQVSTKIPENVLLEVLEVMTDLGVVITSSMKSFRNILKYDDATFIWHAVIPLVFTVTSLIYCPFPAVSLRSITAPWLLSLPLLLLLVMNLMTALRPPFVLVCLVACVWTWILCPKLTSVTIRTQTNSTTCTQRFQAANSSQQVSTEK